MELFFFFFPRAICEPLSLTVTSSTGSCVSLPGADLRWLWRATSRRCFQEFCSSCEGPLNLSRAHTRFNTNQRRWNGTERVSDLTPPFYWNEPRPKVIKSKSVAPHWRSSIRARIFKKKTPPPRQAYSQVQKFLPPRPLFYNSSPWKAVQIWSVSRL